VTKKQKALRGILYPVGVATLVYLAFICFDWGLYYRNWSWWSYHPENLLSVLAWGSLFTAGCIGVAMVSFILKDDITQYLPFLKRKPPRIILYTLSVVSSISFLHYGLYFFYYGATHRLTGPPYPIFFNGDLLSIALELAATFTAGCIGFAIISLILRDYVKQPSPFINHRPVLIASYALAAIGGISLIHSWGLVPPVVFVKIPELVFGVCIGLAAVSLALRDDITQHFPFLMYKPLRITLYVLITASFCWPIFLLAVSLPYYLFGDLPTSVSAFLERPFLEILAFMIASHPTQLLICGSAGFAAATILLRGNTERNFSIAGKITGVCLVITLGLALFLQVPVYTIFYLY
jgi:hypothetical protein